MLSRLEATANQSITQTAESAGTSAASVTRFCRTVGLAGYQALRLELAALVGRERSEESAWHTSVGSDIEPTDSLQSALGALVASAIKVATQTADLLDHTAIDSFVDHIVSAERIDIYATGGSAFVAEEFALKIERLGIFATVRRDSHAAIISASLLGDRDLAIGISHSGSTFEVVEPLATARQKGATTVAITGSSHSPLAAIPHLVVTTTAGDLKHQVNTYPARNAQLLVLDLVFLRLAQRRQPVAQTNLMQTAEAIKDHNRRLAGIQFHIPAPQPK